MKNNRSSFFIKFLFLLFFATGSFAKGVIRQIDITGVWECPVAFVKKSSLKGALFFKADGVLIFRNAYIWLNPASWDFDHQRSILKIKISNMKGSIIKGLESMKEEGDIIHFDPASCIIYYKISMDTKRLNFGGYYFYKK